MVASDFFPGRTPKSDSTATQLAPKPNAAAKLPTFARTSVELVKWKVKVP